MKIETTINKYGVTSSEAFNALYAEKQNAELEWSPRKYRILPIERTKLDDVANALTEWAEDNLQDEDFDEDGEAKRLHEDETVSDFLKTLFSVKKTPKMYTVTVEFYVEAESEGEAQTEAENCIRGDWEYTITDTEEQD